MKYSFEFSAVTTCMIMGITSSIVNATDFYNISWDNQKDKAVYSKNNEPKQDIDFNFDNNILENSSNNSIIMSIGFNTFENSIFGGFLNGENSNNAIVFSDGVINGELVGGRTFFGLVSDNEITILKNAQVKKDIHGGSSFYDKVVRNNVTILDGKANKVYGGYGFETSQVESNQILIYNGNAGDIYGGYSKNGKVASNSVTILDSTVGTVYGGLALGNSASKNIVSIQNTTAVSIYGGFSQFGGNASENKINIVDGNYYNIYGGLSNLGDATHNVITMKVFSTGINIRDIVYGGFVGDIVSQDCITRNILNIGENISYPLLAMNSLNVKNIANFETINFYLPSSVTNDSVALNLYDTGETDLSKSTINAYLQNASNLTADSKIHLIQTAGSLKVADSYKTTNGVEQAGVKNINIANLVNVKGYIKLSDEKNLDLVFKGDTSSGGGSSSGGNTGGGSSIGNNNNNQGGNNNITADENAKLLLEGKLSQSIAVNESTNLFLSNLSDIANSSNNANINNEINNANATVFAFVSGSDKRYKTGSHIDVKGFNASVGVASTDSMQSGNLTTGLFVEYAKGKFESTLDNGSQGEGKTELMGGGAFIKFMTTNNFYTELSGKVGKVKNSYDKSLYDEFSISSTYYGAHLGFGKIFELSNSNDLDIYARGIYSKTAGNDLVLSGVNTRFDSVTSLRTQIGFKDNFKFSDTSKFYIGAAHQYEFDGQSKGNLTLPTFGTANIASPSLKGSTRIAELGYTYETNSIKFDIGAKGYTGKEKGYSGNLGVSFKF